MKNSFAVARIMLLISWRNGTIPGIVALVAGAATLIFFCSTGDNTLVNELQLRIQYSYVLAYALLSLLVISVSCSAVRLQIDNRQMHLLTASPISRREIWIGKWLGLTVVATIAELALLLTLTAAAGIYCRRFSPAEAQAARAHYAVVLNENKPDTPSMRRLTHERIRQLIDQGKLAANAVTAEVWKANYDLVRREEQRIPPGGEKTWVFNLHAGRRLGTHATLKFRLYAENRRQSIQGRWIFSSPGKVESYTANFDVYPYVHESIQIPLDRIPASGRLEVTLVGENRSDIIVNPNSGVRLYYQDGSLANNVMKAFAAQLIHLAVTAGVGVTAAVAFSFSVATFLSLTVYGLSASSTFFSGLAQELTNEGLGTIGEHAAATLIKSGLWLAQGLRPPDIITAITSRVSIPIAELARDWLPAIAVYAVITIGLGIWILTRKELDKIVV